MNKLTKTLLPVVMAVVSVVGMAGSALAAEGDYQKYYDEAMASLEGVNTPKALYLLKQAVEEQIPRFGAYIDIPFGIEEIENLYPYLAESYPDHDIFGDYGGTWIGVGGLIGFLAGVLNPDTGDLNIDSTGDNWNDPAIEGALKSLESKTSTELLQMAKADPQYQSGVAFKAFVDECQSTYDRGVRILRRDLPKLGVTVNDSMTGDELVALAEALPEYTEFGNKKNKEYNDDGTVVMNLYQAYSDLGYFLNCYESTECLLTRDDSKWQDETYATLYAQAKLIDPTFTVDLSSARESKLPGVPDTGDEDQADQSANMIKVAVAGIAGVFAVLGICVMAKSYLTSPLKRK